MREKWNEGFKFSSRYKIRRHKLPFYLFIYLFKPESIQSKKKKFFFFTQINPAEINIVICTQDWQGCTKKKNLKLNLELNI